VGGEFGDVNFALYLYTRYYAVSRPVDLLNSIPVGVCVCADVYTNWPGRGDPISMEIGGSLREYLIYQLITAAMAGSGRRCRRRRRHGRRLISAPQTESLTTHNSDLHERYTNIIYIYYFVAPTTPTDGLFLYNIAC